MIDTKGGFILEEEEEEEHKIANVVHEPGKAGFSTKEVLTLVIWNNMSFLPFDQWEDWW